MAYSEGSSEAVSNLSWVTDQYLINLQTTIHYISFLESPIQFWFPDHPYYIKIYRNTARSILVLALEADSQAPEIDTPRIVSVFLYPLPHHTPFSFAGYGACSYIIRQVRGLRVPYST